MKSLHLKFVVVVEVSLKVNSLKMSIERISSVAKNYSLGAELKKDFILGLTFDQRTKSISKSNRTVKRFYSKRAIESWPLCC